MRRVLPALLSVAAAASRADAGEWRDEFTAREAAVSALCARTGAPAFPATDRPTTQEARALSRGCDPEASYYGIGAPADPVAARKCAFVRLDGHGDPSAGAAVLMMVYANGRGTARNLDVAVALACGAREDVAPAEWVGRLEHLLALRSGEDHGVFDFCDDITSGYMMGYCASLQDRIEARARRERLAALGARIPARARAAFARLVGAAERFFDARVEHEVDLSGTARAALQIGEGARLRAELVSSVEALLASPPAWTERDLAQADRALNEAFRRALAADPWSRGTVTSDGIRAAQRRWLPYRDAWGEFGHALHPSVPASAWKAWVTRQRTEMLAR